MEAIDYVAPALLRWSAKHGRHDLPWQTDRTPYRVWVSEIMLQQTQVASVLGFYGRFMARFPTVKALAAASLDEVLHLWSGLGYYARARNLHHAARIVVERHAGNVPQDFDTLHALPGIGRSTAGAILALSASQRHPILDGNARRVLARYFGIEGHVSDPDTRRRLWSVAEACTPMAEVAAYTQAIMDLGAGVCTRSSPGCDTCPLQRHCVARATSRQAELPAARRRRERPHRSAFALVLRRGEALALERRPLSGLWAGLWCFPILDTREEVAAWLASNLNAAALPTAEMPVLQHAFTHFDLSLLPLVVELDEAQQIPPGLRWYDPAHPERIGLAKPVLEVLLGT